MSPLDQWYDQLTERSTKTMLKFENARKNLPHFSGHTGIAFSLEVCPESCHSVSMRN
jgi:hypothetical protein